MSDQKRKTITILAKYKHEHTLIRLVLLKWDDDYTSSATYLL